jgi:aspartate aminotransferase
MQDQTRFVAPGIAASLSGATAGMPDTPIAEVSMSVFGDPDVVPLWFGESDLVTPDFVRDAAAKGLQAGETFYTWQRGIPELRAALAAYTERLYRIKCPADRITVTTGGMQAILLTCQLLLDPGDNIVIVSPIWPNITSATKLVGGEPKYVALDRTPTGGWTLDLQKVFDAVDARTRAIFVNSPGNPTGWTMTAEEQRTLLDFAKKRGLWIMADEVYARLIYSKRPDGRQVAPSFLEQAGSDDPLIVLNSFSKPWAMTGWRLGWLTHPAQLGEQFAKLVQINTSGVPGFLQRGGHRGDREGRRLRHRDGRTLPGWRRTGVPAALGLAAGHDLAAGGGLLCLLLGRRRDGHTRLLQDAGEEIQGRSRTG